MYKHWYMFKQWYIFYGGEYQANRSHLMYISRCIIGGLFPKWITICVALKNVGKAFISRTCKAVLQPPPIWDVSYSSPQPPQIGGVFYISLQLSNLHQLEVCSTSPSNSATSTNWRCVLHLPPILQPPLIGGTFYISLQLSNLHQLEDYFPSGSLSVLRWSNDNLY